LLRFSDSTIYQTWSYGKVRWGGKNISHFILKRNGEVVGIAQVIIKRASFLKIGMAYVPWGPIWLKKGAGKDLEIFKTLVAALKAEYSLHRGLLLRISPKLTTLEDVDYSVILANVGFGINSKATPYRTLILDLSPSLDEIRKKLHQKWRNQLNRAEKNELRIVEGDSDELYQGFLNLQTQMLMRKEYIPGVNYNEFGEIQNALPKSLKMIIMICEHKREPICALVGSAIGDTGIYLLGATGDKGLKQKGSYLLQWRMIQRLKESGCRWYDLGGINPEKNPGVYHFKAGLSGKDVYHLGHFEICDSHLNSFFVKTAGYLTNIRRKFLNPHR
jgi:lipid II:glycine glycyltransferase (peptidoglycan interpeptide bridge formation enzyme)